MRPGLAPNPFASCQGPTPSFRAESRNLSDERSECLFADEPLLIGTTTTVQVPNEDAAAAGDGSTPLTMTGRDVARGNAFGSDAEVQRTLPMRKVEPLSCLRRVVMLCCLGFDLLAFAFILLALLNGVTLGEAAAIGKTDAIVMVVLSILGILVTLLLGLILWLFGSGGRGPARTRIQELERQNQRLRDALRGSSDLTTDAIESHDGTDPRSIRQAQVRRRSNE